MVDMPMSRGESPAMKPCGPRVAGPGSRRAVWLAVVVLATVLVGPGCASHKWATLRSVPRNPLAEQFDLKPGGPLKPSDRTLQLLRIHDLEKDLAGDPHELLEKLQALHEREPSLETLYALSELSYQAAQRVEHARRQEALDLYGASVLSAYQYLFDPRFPTRWNPYDPHFRGACDLYNGSLEAALRLISKDGQFKPGGGSRTIETAGGDWDIKVVVRGGQWKDEDFDHFRFVSDYQMQGLRNHFRGYGLGVPLIAVRRGYEGEPEAAKYYPSDLSFPVTAFFRPVGGYNVHGGSGGVHYRAELEIYDPLASSTIAVGRQRVPLESDLSTPLAYFLSHSRLDQLELVGATLGLLDPEKLLKEFRPGHEGESAMGLYMMQPYEPDKIPVLFVHGLWSSPITWIQMFNDLRNSPEIRRHYQFWFYLYPTGQPYWFAAAQLRDDLARARTVLDPGRENPALDQMVLVGHSMGGLISRLQTLDSGNDFWSMVSDRPFTELKAEPDARAKLQEVLFFHPSASVQRVITIGTPHRGSRFSNDTTQLLMSQLVKLPDRLVGNQERLLRDNPGFFRDTRLLSTSTSIDSLSPDSPMFAAMIAARRAPWVRYHNVLGLVPKKGLFGRLAAGTDGVVARESAHMDDVDSELVVEADHSTVHIHPRTVLEVRRILLEHVASLRSIAGAPELLQATRPVARPSVYR